MRAEHANENEARNALRSQLSRVSKDGRWFGAICQVRDDGKISVLWTTYRFPRNKIMEAVAKIGEQLSQEIKEPDHG